MKTTATNREIREILKDIESETLVIKPTFQRRLVWKNRDKCNFLQTVLDGYPFPEIYVATGEVNPDTGEGSEILVDGQQRVSTLLQYFDGSSDLKLDGLLPRYADLPGDAKERFLQYNVVVRDLGALHDSDIRKVFHRINSTGYSLNAIEIHNSRFDGEFKAAAEKIAEHDFFADHRVFSANEIRRMQDTRFILGYMTTVMLTYFHRDKEIESFLEMYNEDFPHAGKILSNTERVLAFIEGCDFELSSRAWRRADIFTLLVETYRALGKDRLDLSPTTARQNLKEFYDRVNADDPDGDAAIYRSAALQGSNDRSSRIRRGEIVAGLLRM